MSRRRFIGIISAVILVVVTGVAGYMIIEGWSFLDALYMTVITISTVGYEEVGTLSVAGKAFSIVLIIGGVGVVSYTAITVVQYFIEGRLANILGRRRMKEKIARLKNHVILCGYGRVGREIAEVFISEKAPFVVIDNDDGALEKAESDGHLHIKGNATSDETLMDAGIVQARALVAALGNDADNLYITLSAKELRRDLFIVARVSSRESEY